jgi:hypothetical protein
MYCFLEHHITITAAKQMKKRFSIKSDMTDFSSLLDSFFLSTAKRKFCTPAGLISFTMLMMREDM